jgi:phosphatidylcholine synthase
MVVLVIFSVHPHWFVTTLVVLALVAAMFANLKFIHPTRTKRWRLVSLPIALIWTSLATMAAWQNFDAPTWVNFGLVGASCYLIFAGIAQQIFPQKSKIII